MLSKKLLPRRNRCAFSSYTFKNQNNYKSAFHESCDILFVCLFVCFGRKILSDWRSCETHLTRFIKLLLESSDRHLRVVSVIWDRDDWIQQLFKKWNCALLKSCELLLLPAQSELNMPSSMRVTPHLQGVQNEHSDWSNEFNSKSVTLNYFLEVTLYII